MARLSSQTREGKEEKKCRQKELIELMRRWKRSENSLVSRLLAATNNKAWRNEGTDEITRAWKLR